MLGAMARRAHISASLFRQTLTNRHNRRAASWPVVRRTFKEFSVANDRGEGHIMSCQTFLRRESERGLHKLLRVSG